jgi:hypothetical protein
MTFYGFSIFFPVVITRVFALSSNDIISGNFNSGKAYQDEDVLTGRYITFPSNLE